eukprot:gb/GECH01008059.1/.p1 GENE.gb/GECH01008059.1/~~gb/GECH01008059.1/.p1  ORF type:complete len:565 (+),score=149.91 gb/GECH01008059.1/:1-1695(+)
MDVIESTQKYFTRMIHEVDKGMKVLLLDENTINFISMVYTQRQILENEVYLVEKIDSGEKRDKMGHLKCVCFLRPTSKSISMLCDELKNPKYEKYFLFFSNILTEEQIREIALADENELVFTVQEYFADYLAVNRDLFSLDLPSVSKLIAPRWDSDLFWRIYDGVLSSLLSLKKRPLIRYSSRSELCRNLSQKISKHIDLEHELFTFGSDRSSPLLLLVDRRDDPVTPLLSQWSYQAMAHELVGIHHNRVVIDAPGSEKQEVVLSSEHDDFFRDHMFSSFGDLCMNIKDLVEEYQEKAQVSKSINTIQDMRNFLDEYPQFRQLSSKVSKHLNLVSELNRIQGDRELMDISPVEQQIACGNSQSSDYNSIMHVLRNNAIEVSDAVRLVMLYALRWESSSSNRTTDLLDELVSLGASRKQIQLINRIVQYGGSSFHHPELFDDSKYLTSLMKHFTEGLNDVPNMLTQHKPVLHNVLEQAIKGKLKESHYSSVSETSKEKHADIIVFMVGGTTYEEAVTVHEMRKKYPGVRIVLGGTTIHNSTSFIREIELATGEAQAFSQEARDLV